MAYLNIKDFKLGMDRRSSRITGEPGSLWTLVNGHITRSGEIERMKAFTSTYTLPANTFGLHATATTLYVFGSASAPTMPSGVSYQRLQHESGHDMADILDTENFAGKIYAIARYSNGDVRHFFDGTRVAEWDPLPKATRCLTHRQKMYSVAGNTVYFSAIDDPAHVTSGTGDGFLKIADQNSLGESLTGLGVYQNGLAFFSARSSQIWNIDPDDLKNALLQIISNSGTPFPKSIVEYGSRDTYYLDRTGVRSLRIREGQSAAFVNDPGSPMDPFISAHVAGLGASVQAKICAVIEPTDGRFWLAAGNRVYVLSYFPSAKISAWSYYQNSFNISELVVLDGRVYGRSSNTIYRYGGSDNATYPDASTNLVLVEFPYLDAGKPATRKNWKGIDIACTGTWDFEMLVDPADEAVKTTIGTFSRTSWREGSIPFSSDTTHVAPRLVSRGAGAATLSAMAIHYAGTSDPN